MRALAILNPPIQTLHRMIILNAPAGFGTAWQVIKRFIDPQTAARISVFSDKKSGHNSLLDIIDIDQIPIDYGGTNKSIQQVFLEEANDPYLIRQEIELLHVKRKGKTKSNKVWTIKDGERLDLTCYTRSCSGASCCVKLNGSNYKVVEQIVGNTYVDENSGHVGGDHSGIPKPTSYNLLSGGILGSPEGVNITVELQDLDNAKKNANGNSLSRGYFLVVGNVRRQT